MQCVLWSLIMQKFSQSPLAVMPNILLQACVSNDLWLQRLVGFVITLQYTFPKSFTHQPTTSTKKTPIWEVKQKLKYTRAWKKGWKLHLCKLFLWNQKGSNSSNIPFLIYAKFRVYKFKSNSCLVLANRDSGQEEVVKQRHFDNIFLSTVLTGLAQYICIYKKL
jgi:hypothetical protein